MPYIYHVLAALRAEEEQRFNTVLAAFSRHCAFLRTARYCWHTSMTAHCGRVSSKQHGALIMLHFLRPCFAAGRCWHSLYVVRRLTMFKQAFYYLAPQSRS